MNTEDYSEGNSSYLKPAETAAFDTIIIQVLEDTDFNNKKCLTVEVKHPDADDEFAKIQLKWYQVKELQELYGKDSDAWEGQAIHVAKGEVTAQDTIYPKFVFEYRDNPTSADGGTGTITDTTIEVITPPVADLTGGDDDLPF